MHRLIYTVSRGATFKASQVIASGLWKQRLRLYYIERSCRMTNQCIKRMLALRLDAVCDWWRSIYIMKLNAGNKAAHSFLTGRQLDDAEICDELSLHDEHTLKSLSPVLWYHMVLSIKIVLSIIIQSKMNQNSHYLQLYSLMFAQYTAAFQINLWLHINKQSEEYMCRGLR